MRVPDIRLRTTRRPAIGELDRPGVLGVVALARDGRAVIAEADLELIEGDELLIAAIDERACGR
jgi:hypothetical protein